MHHVLAAAPRVPLNAAVDVPTLNLRPVLVDDLAWLGHSGFRIDAGSRTIYIDPYRVPAGSRKADLILITHGHYDHFSPQDVERLTKPNTEVIAPAAVAERLSGHVRSIAAGEEIDP